MGSRNASPRRPFLEETPVFTVCLHPGPWSDSRLSLLGALGASAVRALLELQPLTSQALVGIPPRTCLHPGTARLLAGVCWSGSQEPPNLTPQRGCREQGPLTHGSILDIYSPGLSEPCSAPGMALSTGTHRWEHSPRREGTRSPVGEGHTPPDGGRRVMPYTGSMGRAVGSLRVLWVASNRVRP